MALCYNFTRVLNIVGFDGFVASVREWLAARVNLLPRSTQNPWRPAKTILAALLERFALQASGARRRLASLS
jgi:hypothetical protein